MRMMRGSGGSARTADAEPGTLDPKPQAPYGSFRKLGVPYFGVLKIRILLSRVLY